MPFGETGEELNFIPMSGSPGLAVILRQTRVNEVVGSYPNA